MKSYLSHSLEETSAIAAGWLTFLENKRSGVANGEADRATIVGLTGHLGSGKTAFVKAVAKHLGISEDITSPTFVIMKIYPTNSAQATSQVRSAAVRWKSLVHIDAYRLGKAQEIKVLGLDKLISDADNLIMIEWVEQVKDELPSMIMVIDFEDQGGDKKIKLPID